MINDNCFTDGCSSISLAVMKEVADILGCEKTHSILQGRIGGQKVFCTLNHARMLVAKNGSN